LIEELEAIKSRKDKKELRAFLKQLLKSGRIDQQQFQQIAANPALKISDLLRESTVEEKGENVKNEEQVNESILESKVEGVDKDVENSFSTCIYNEAIQESDVTAVQKREKENED